MSEEVWKTLDNFSKYEISSFGRIPLDIIINHIIPYTYTIQPTLLLEDIQNYHKIKTILMDNKYDTDIIKHEILAIFYMNEPKLTNILDRHFQIHQQNYDYNIIYKYSQNTKFNILFGLFTTKERTYFAEYILQNLMRWVL
jgi:hypothetical protein